jgi:quinoprotein glucose dehydrogenase
MQSVRVWSGAAGMSLLAALMIVGAAAAASDEWIAYGHDPGGARFSPLKQIDRANVARLTPAWTFHTGDIAPGGSSPRSGFESTPLFVDGMLILTTGFNRVIALDPVSGAQRWAYDPKINRSYWYGDGMINRGAATWLDRTRATGQPCRRRVYEATLDARLIALDAASGRPCGDFGAGGEVSLRDVPRYRAGIYHMTSPPAVVDDVVVVGSAIDDNGLTDMPSGVIRGFDARTGALRWSFEPLSASPGIRSGAGNAWSAMAVDGARHMVFAPTGSASPDFFGGLRPGDNKWANSVLAIDARTGKLAWGFQLVHHDLWDNDSAAPPLLAEIPIGGKPRPVVVQGNKTGLLYVLDRTTGEPVQPVEERPVPASDVPGESASPTQPFPTIIPPLAPQKVTPGEAWGPTPADQAACKALLDGMSGLAVFSPPSLKGALIIPGNIGGMNWGGYALDPGRGLLIAAATNLPYWVKLIPAADYDKAPRLPGMEYARQAGAAYGMMRGPLRSPSGAPCVAPPWGSIVAVDLAKGAIAWRTPVGSLRDLGGADFPTGSPVLGGPIVTAGGLVFVAGTIDRRLRALDVETGKVLWTADLPASGHAMPMTYEVGGRQYVVIAAGGSAKITEEVQGDAVVAFALP